MGAAKRIKQLMLERGKSVKDVANLLDIAPQSLSNKLCRDSFSFDDVSKIADFLEADVQIVTRDSKKVF